MSRPGREKGSANEIASRIGTKAEDAEKPHTNSLRLRRVKSFRAVRAK
ncbi:MAG: hypothetical protein BLITH_1097 [Brockia lithotrophica]|uniref:Uncharacterized protein n=1 Tax=Brockia lithotrophica TaxID=933949 RepID=A0A2T5G7G5_9BACL|nr:MAG: hypothetical protein BLITH_1097 [Brockia lithotrophica]